MAGTRASVVVFFIFGSCRGKLRRVEEVIEKQKKDRIVGDLRTQYVPLWTTMILQVEHDTMALTDYSYFVNCVAIWGIVILTANIKLKLSG